MEKSPPELSTDGSIETPINASFQADPPTDGGYGWVQVGVAFTINAFTWGQTAVCFPYFYELKVTDTPSPTPST